MAKTIIELRDVWKIYDLGEVQVEALRGLTLSIKKGEFVAIKGASGSGKSTAVNQIGCLDLPTKGEVLLDAKNISLLSESSLAEMRGKKIGFIFQQFNLIPTLTAMENVALPMVFQDVPKEERIRRASYLLNMVGLGDRLDHRPGQLSGGQQQRVAIARSLINDPEVIIADEPTGALDSKTGLTVLSFLNQLHKKGKTIIMVTHDEKLALFANRIVQLMDGRVQKDEPHKGREAFLKKLYAKDRSLLGPAKELLRSTTSTKKKGETT